MKSPAIQISRGPLHGTWDAAVTPSRSRTSNSPGNPLNLGDITESDTHELYPALIQALAPLNLAYLHISHGGDEELLRTLRKLWPSTLVLNRGGAVLATRAEDGEDGLADVITVGVPVLANPDLVERIRVGAPLNAPDPETFTGTAQPATPTTPPSPPLLDHQRVFEPQGTKEFVAAGRGVGYA